MQSMTGYGSGRAALGDGHVVLDVRAVNHRFLDVRVRLPSRIQARTPTVERVIRAEGKIESMEEKIRGTAARIDKIEALITKLLLLTATSAVGALGGLVWQAVGR